MAAQRFKKGNVRKIFRKMFELQVQLHRERFAYLEGHHCKGSFDGIVLLPSRIDVEEELGRDDGDSSPWTSSQIRKALHDYEKDESPGKAVPGHLEPFLKTADSTQIPSFALTLSPSYWFFVRDSTNTHVLYALQAAILRRAGEFLPEMGAVNIRIRKAKGGVSACVVEIPDREAHSRGWSPRRFQYGGRNFVWKGRADGKSADGGLFKCFGWETLFETRCAWPKDGSRSGKMEDETVGPRLCWGEKGGGNGADRSIFLVRGPDQQFREHLLASQLARLVRCSYLPQKDTKGVEAASAGLSILAIADLVS
ncbi:hypothetical protein BDW75DRAFT_234957 [Aspergillus navahoensis]